MTEIFVDLSGPCKVLKLWINIAFETPWKTISEPEPLSQGSRAHLKLYCCIATHCHKYGPHHLGELYKEERIFFILRPGM